MSVTNPPVLPSLHLDLTTLQEETHEKYGVSYTMSGNNFLVNGVPMKLFTFNKFEDVTLPDGRVVKVKNVMVSFKPVKAAAPVSVSPTAELERQLAELRKANAKLAKAAEKTAGRTPVGLGTVFDSHATPKQG